MQNVELTDVPYSKDYDINVRVIAFSIVAVVLILVAIFFIKTYSLEKQKTLKLLSSESAVLETFCHDTFEHNLYILKLLSSRMSRESNDMETIYGIFKRYISIGDIHSLFGWNDLVWLDENLVPRVSSKRGILSADVPMDVHYTRLSRQKPGKLLYGRDVSQNIASSSSLSTAIGVIDNNGKYIGTILVNYDMEVLGDSLKRHRKHTYTNFVLIDRSYKIVTQSQPIIPGVGIEKGRIVNKYTDDLIRSISTKDDVGKEISYLDMVHGVNYFIKKIEREPFILLVNIDHDEIKNKIFHSVIMKFFETSILAAFVLVMVVSIYRRETWLRAKAESASKIALQATTSKSDFLAFTAHEIRSPLGFILTGSEMMQKEALGPLAAEYKPYVEGIYNNASSILEFLTDILDEEHILAGTFKTVNTINSIEQIIDTAILNNRMRYSSRVINIKHEIEDALPSLICDKRRILQVISNLISNSIKYSEDDTTLKIMAYMRNHELVVEVVDEGIGMENDEIAIAFTKYGTVHKERFNFIESYGLGLPIVKLLLDAHDASISVTSVVNVGTTVTIVFPKYKLVYDMQVGSE